MDTKNNKTGRKSGASKFPTLLVLDPCAVTKILNNLSKFYADSSAFSTSSSFFFRWQTVHFPPPPVAVSFSFRSAAWVTFVPTLLALVSVSVLSKTPFTSSSGASIGEVAPSAGSAVVRRHSRWKICPHGNDRRVSFSVEKTKFSTRQAWKLGLQD